MKPEIVFILILILGLLIIVINTDELLQKGYDSETVCLIVVIIWALIALTWCYMVIK